MRLPPFEGFFRALHGHDSYLWQRRAAQELAASGWWPALRAPTGAGKTTLIDCWLHGVAAAGPDELGRRLVWVVDRRSVVDQVYAYAADVVTRLTAPGAGPEVQAVANALRELGGGDAPRAVLWRGGLDDEGSIAMRDPLDPAAAAVVVSTVDQLGSRLLFRGYGLGIGSRALHAGMLGLDTTVVLDEAHIAEPLRRTVSRVASLQSAASCSPRPPLRLCAVSATHDEAGAFELTEKERAEEAIARRIKASKPARLCQGAAPADVAKHIQELASTGAQVVGVVLNTVADARAAFDALTHAVPLQDRVLLIGPVRSIDRDDLLAAIPDRARRTGRTEPFVVVATQTIEVGVDLDFDALISACAPLDALVQRFGRLDRAGDRGTSDARILAPPNKGCPVYGELTTETWAWLESAADEAVVDLGVEALRRTIARRGRPPTQPKAPTIELLDLHVDALMVTDASDDEGPDIELLLHGVRRPSVEVSIAWRRFPPPEDGADRPSPETITRELALRPLHPGEILTVSVGALRRWLAARDADGLSDVESIGEGEHAAAGGGGAQIAAWHVGADAEVELIEDPHRLRPTGRIVISADAGGVDGFGWAPRGRTAATDLGSLAARGPRLVLDDEDADVAAIVAALESGDLTRTEAARNLKLPIERALPDPDDRRPALSGRIAGAAQALTSGRASLLDDGRVLVVGKGARSGQAPAGHFVALDRHQIEVDAHLARGLTALGIDSALSDSLRRAARHHDEGKRDPRFQAWLRGSRAVAVDALAKSAYPYDPARVQRLRESSGWPAGKRHELVSAVAVAQAFPEDPLAAWLVATHHGRNRPFPASVEDSAIHEVVTSIGERMIAVPCAGTPSTASQLETLVELSARYGPWGLAFLEALLVSADRVVSAAGGA